MKPAFVLSLLALAVTGIVTGIVAASHRPDVQDPGSQPVSSRFTLVRQGEVDDFGASNGKRYIYVLTDTRTGAEYVGVSGIGISEIRGGRLPSEE